MAYKIAISGSRRFPGIKSWVVHHSLGTEYTRHEGDVLFLVGDCPTGIDLISRNFFKEHDYSFKEFKADWGKYGNAAGPIRNNEMIDYGADELIAYPDSQSKGTKECCMYAYSHGIPVFFPEMELWHKWAAPLTLFRKEQVSDS